MIFITFFTFSPAMSDFLFPLHFCPNVANISVSAHVDDELWLHFFKEKSVLRVLKNLRKIRVSRKSAASRNFKIYEFENTDTEQGVPFFQILYATNSIGISQRRAFFPAKNLLIRVASSKLNSSPSINPDSESLVQNKENSTKKHGKRQQNPPLRPRLPSHELLQRLRAAIDPSLQPTKLLHRLTHRARASRQRQSSSRRPLDLFRQSSTSTTKHTAQLLRLTKHRRRERTMRGGAALYAQLAAQFL